MKTILNVIWLVLCGFWMALGYIAAGIICCILIITIPFGIASFRIAVYALWPFGRTVVRKPTAGVASAIGNVIWLIFAGIWLAIGHVVTGIAMCLTIIGIPLGIASFKMIPISLLPLGAEIVDTDRGALVPPSTAY
ncbi:YccF domain-containing protein [Williamsia sp.]|uniref:YccF domain-containing protein n=1 Tax=Williamsia sp. TaxID=1872085 RepID=UPI002F92DD5A